MKKKIIIIFILIIITGISWYLIRGFALPELLRMWLIEKRQERQAVERTFNGYIYWGVESIMFIENIDFDNENQNFKLIGEKIWVVDAYKFDLYENAYKFNDKIDRRIIKTEFRGMYYPAGHYGHMNQYPHQIKITEVIDYSNDFY